MVSAARLKELGNRAECLVLVLFFAFAPAMGQEFIPDKQKPAAKHTVTAVTESPRLTKAPFTVRVAQRLSSPMVARVPHPRPQQDGLTVVMTEDFEGTFPSGLWQVGTGDYTWARRNVAAHSGSYSAWAIGGGTIGSTLPAGSHYPNSTETVMAFGPFDLGGVNYAALSFFVSLNTEESFDFFYFAASDNGVDFYGYQISGSTGGSWLPFTLPLHAVADDVGGIRNFTGDQSVWVLFGFESDGSITFPEGVFVDDVALVKGMLPVAAVVDSFASPGASPRGLAYDGVNLRCADRNDLLITTLSTAGAVLSSFASPGGGPSDLAWDGTRLWNADAQSDRIYKLSPAGAILGSFPSPGPTPTGLTWDGAALWNSDVSTDTLRRIDSTGAVVGGFPAPGSFHQGLAWDGANLWMVDAEALLLYRMETSGHVAGSYLVPGTFPTGLTWDGTFFWLADPDNNLVYKLSVTVQTFTNDLGAAGMILPPVLPPADTAVVRALVRNHGTAAQSNCAVSYSVNGGPPVTETFGGPFLPGQTDTVTFTQPWAPPTEGTYSFRAWTSLAGDERPSNDTLGFPVIVQVRGNAPPELTPVAGQAVAAGGTKTIRLIATDADGDPLSFSLDLNPGFLSLVGFSQTGDTASVDLTMSPGGSVAGLFTGAVRVTDGQGGADADTFSIQVIAPQPAGSWVSQHPRGPEGRVRDLFFFDQQVGWAVGDRVSRTVDGGQTWEEVPTGAREATGVFFLDAQKGWVVGSECTPACVPTIYATTDGGTTWGKQANAGWGTLRKIRFATSSRGWVVGGLKKDPGNTDALILTTTNGGSTWTEYVITGFTSSQMEGICFVDSLVGWAVGRIYPSGALIRKTTDGGLTWTAQSSPVASALLSVHFVDYLAGWAVGESGLILKTTNGGTDWVQQPSGETASLLSVWFSDASAGWIAGGNYVTGIVLKTTNGGVSWERQDALAHLNAVQFVDGLHGLIGGESGIFLTTDNGGAAWVNRSFVTRNQLSAAWISDASTGWVAGARGTILKTTSAGETWEVVPTPNTYVINEITFADSRHGWACQSSGRMLRTTDGGSSWIASTTSTQRAFHGMGFIDAKTGWAVGGGSVYRVIFKTTDGGGNWTEQAAPPGECLMDVCFTDSLFGWAVGMESTILHTTDGGSSWFPQTNGVPANTWLNGVFFMDRQTGFVVGDGEILKTTDGGASWVPKASPNGVVEDVTFVDALNGWAVGTAAGVAKGIDGNGAIDLYGGDSEVWQTTDGGDTWSGDSSPPGSWLLAVFFTDLNSGWAVGRYGRILKYTNTLPLPAPPSGLTVTASSGGTTRLTWTDNSDNETGFRIYRRIGDVGGFRLLAVSGADATAYTDSGLTNGTTYWYRLHAFNGTGRSAYCRDASATAAVVAVGPDANIPTLFALSQNYPNPFNPVTTIRYAVPRAGHVVIKVYSMLGEEVLSLADRTHPPGMYEVRVDASLLSSGVYFYRMWAGEFSSVKKMMVLR